ncbi:MAG: iron ABC transporter permease [Gammaproteobacteria bacterium]|nr:iron ABC transporter permease [Gammaproteobacteria bacterium]
MFADQVPQAMTKTYGLASLLIFVSILCLASNWWMYEPMQVGRSVELEKLILYEIRLPKSLSLWLSGALLGMAGALAQGLFRNPLADPYLIGTASGASLAITLFFFGISMGYVDILPMLEKNSIGFRAWVTLVAFGGAWLASLLTLCIVHKAENTTRFILAGVIVGVIFTALNAMLTYIMPSLNEKVRFFQWGTSSGLDQKALLILTLVWLVSLIGALPLARGLDVLSLGADTARSMGMTVHQFQWLIVGWVALLSATTVSLAGIIPFIGLLAPQLVQAVIKVTYAKLLVLTSLAGGSIMLVADSLVNWLFYPQQIPIGIVASMIGGVYLLFVVRNTKVP